MNAEQIATILNCSICEMCVYSKEHICGGRCKDGIIEKLNSEVEDGKL